MSVPKALTMGDGDPGSTVEWQTPNALFDAYDAEFGPFTLDPATAVGFHTSDVILARGGSIAVAPTERFPAGVCGALAFNGSESVRCTYLDKNHDPRWHHFDVDDFAPVYGGEQSVKSDGLSFPWTGRVWLNHPYGRDDWRWMKKAHDSVRFGDAEIVVALVPVKTQMKWWRKYVGATELTRIADLDTKVLSGYYAAKSTGTDVIRFVPGRLRFGGAPSSAPFNSAVIVWRK